MSVAELLAGGARGAHLVGPARLQHLHERADALQVPALRGRSERRLRILKAVPGTAAGRAGELEQKQSLLSIWSA